MKTINLLAVCALVLVSACGGAMSSEDRSDSIDESNTSETSSNDDTIPATAASGGSTSTPSSDAKVVVDDMSTSPINGGIPASTNAVATEATSYDTVEAPSTYTNDPDVSCLQKNSFRLPQDGERNHNEAIGPFCCTGWTVTVNDRESKPLGYIYFMGFASAVNLGRMSYAARADIYVSSLPRYGVADTQLESVIMFTTSEIMRGTNKTIVIGALRYTARVIHADVIWHNDQQLFNMDTLLAIVDVELANPKECTVP